jgi:hypothetical protein
MANVNRENLTPKLYYRATWSASWTELTTFEPLYATDAVPSQALSELQFRYRYGELQQPGGSSFATVTPIDLVGQWVKLEYNYGTTGTPDFQPLFCGRVELESREVFGKQGAAPAAGVPTFTAFGPARILEKRTVARSVWDDGAATFDVNWLAPMNAFDERNLIIGNRGNSKLNGVYWHSENAATWNNRDYVDYLVNAFLNDSTNADEPVWQLQGDTNALADLANIERPIVWGEVESLADMLAQLIPREAGLDYFIRLGSVTPAAGGAAVDGFALHVFSLTPSDVTFGTTTLRANTNTVSFNATNNYDFDRGIFEKSAAETYGTLRVIGNRAVLCASFQRGPTASELDDGWSSTLESEYEAGTGSDSDPAQAQDDYRADDKFRDVYQMWHVIPTISGASYFPTIDADGSVDWTTEADHQDLIRETLSWLPIKQGFDYTTDPPTDDSTGDTEPPFLPPMAWIQRGESSTVSGSDEFVWCDRVGVGVSPLPNDWGIQLSSYPNHLIAGGFFTATANRESEIETSYTYENLAITIAFETDQRLALEATLTDDSNAAGVKEIYVPDAELWLLAPQTKVGLDGNGDFIFAPVAGVTLRSDVEKLEQIMAGAKARYQAERAKAFLSVKGIWDWSEGLGYILEYINDGASTDAINGPITSVRWDFTPEHKTELSAGYAV